MFTYEDIKTLHLELTDRCNANCPMCPRSQNGGYVNPNLRLTELALSDIKRILPQEFIEQLKFIYLCGNYGDPIVARDTLEILTYFREVNPNISLAMFTNASARDTSWWAKLGDLLRYPGDFVRFSIDGLEDTNHLYRQNTNWNRIMANAQAFISTGGVAFWDFLVFEHNSHQIEEASKLATKMGFKRFYTKYSSRFVKDSGIQYIESFPVYDSEGKFQRFIRPLPDNYKSISAEANPIVETVQTRVSRSELSRWEPNWNDPDHKASSLKECVNCQAISDREIYISAEGFVMPCCWTAFTIRTTLVSEHIKQLRGLIFEHGLENFSAFNKPIRDIIEDKFFQTTLVQGWNKKSTNDGQLMICHKFCGNRSFVKQEFANETNLEVL